MNALDYEIIVYMNQFAQRSWLLDKTLSFWSGHHVFKGGVLITLFWWAWFRSGQQQRRHRNHILLTLFCSLLAISAARGLALTLPFRQRPMHEAELHFVLPYGMETSILEGWSSFPSDHAVLFMALSTGFFFVSQRAGLLATLYSTLFILLPRIYLGLHYPSDIIFGALMGITIALMGNRLFCSRPCIQAITNWSYTKPQFFYPLYFLMMYQVTEMFDSSRTLMMAGWKIVHGLLT